MPEIPVLLRAEIRFSPTTVGDPPYTPQIWRQELPWFEGFCQLLDEEHSYRHGLPDAPIDTEGVSIIPARELIGLAFVYGGSESQFLNYFEKATISLPDGKYSIYGGEILKIGTTTPPPHFPPYLQNYTYWGVNSFERENYYFEGDRAINSVTIQISESRFRAIVRWINDSVHIDNDIYWQGWTQCEFIAGTFDELTDGDSGIVVTGSPTGGTQGFDGVDHGFDQYGVPLTFTTFHRWWEAFFEFDSAMPVAYRLRSPYGEYSPWVELKVIPEGHFDLNEDSEVDAGSSVAVTSPIVNYRFQYTDPDSGDLVIQDSDSPALDVGELLASHEGETLEVYLAVTSEQGCIGEYNGTITLKEDFVQFGSFIDRTGTLYSAVNEGNNVRVSRFKQGVASRELLALVPNAKNPSLALVSARGTQLLSYEDRSDGAQKLVRSTDGGRTFQ
jgi:hypothetical protein